MSQPLQYAPPPTGPNANLRKIAKQQRTLMYCILSEIFILLASMVLRGSLPPILAILLYLAYVGIAVTATVYVFMLAISLYNVALGVVLGILTLVPLVGLLILLTVNGKATRVLRAHGVRVGLLGADPSTLPAA